MLSTQPSAAAGRSLPSQNAAVRSGFTMFSTTPLPLVVPAQIQHSDTRSRRSSPEHVTKQAPLPRSFLSTTASNHLSFPAPSVVRERELDRMLAERLQEEALSDIAKDRVHRCISQLESVAERLGPQWNVSIFGSICTGFITKGSDLDVTFHLSEEQHIDSHFSAQWLRERLVPEMSNEPGFEIVEEILGARVPIVKMKFEDLEVDISCHNVKPLHNTRLLRSYCNLDRRVRDLGNAVKLWAKAAGVVGATSGYMSSYSLIMMVIYFLQVDQEVSLPQLHVDAFKHGTPDLRTAHLAWEAQRCRFTTGQLLERFFQFYTEQFHWGEEVVSIRVGQRRSQIDAVFSQLRNKRSGRVSVEDPCAADRNLNCVLGQAQEAEFKFAMNNARETLVSGGFPVGLQLFVEPLPFDSTDMLQQLLKHESVCTSIGKTPPSCDSTHAGLSDDRASVSSGSAGSLCFQ